MNFDIVRAWKDEEYRQSLNEEQINQLPANPVGELELSSRDLEDVCGTGGGIATPIGGLGAGGPVPVPGGGGCGGSTLLSGFSLQSFALGQNSCDNLEFSLTFVSGPNLVSPIQPFCVNNQR